MKQLHRSDLWGWSVFNVERNLDFNSVAWIRPEGNVLVDPMPLCDHDRGHLAELGGAGVIVVTTSDHLRAAEALAREFDAELVGPRGERESLPAACSRFVGEGDQVVPGLVVMEMHGSKTPGELALCLEGSTLITGDLVRGQRGGQLNLLPDAKLADPRAARQSVDRLAGLQATEVVLVGDGWHVWSGGQSALRGILTQ